MDEISRRVERLEVGHAFAERTADQLSAELLRAYEQIARLTTRLEALERRLGEIESGPEETGE
ncbi:MAG: SlyX family protein [Phycisphaerae bacterium]|nr:SlyX family protein [Phycisphaerae bacterium]